MSCLIITPEEANKYKELGVPLNEIHRDFIEFGSLRSPMAIKFKIDKRENEAVTINRKSPTQEFDNSSAEEWIEQLSSSLGVESFIIPVSVAQEMHTLQGKTYSGESAFFHDGKVYFLQGVITPEIVVHEFSHPIIKSLSQELRDNLFSKLKNTEIGKTIISDTIKLYSTKEDDPSLKEEVLVRALTSSVRELNGNIELDSFIDKLMYAIKQFLRNIVGQKINISKLNAQTSLRELANILKEGNIETLKPEIIGSKDVFDYYKNQEQALHDLENVISEKGKTTLTTMQTLIDSVFDAAVTQRKYLEDNPVFNTFNDLLINETNSGILDQIKTTLSGQSIDHSNRTIVQSLDAKFNDEFVHSAVTITNRLNNLLTSLTKVDELQSVMLSELKKMTNVDKENVDRLLVYKNFNQQWRNTIGLFRDASYGIDQSSELKNLSVKLENDHIEIGKQIESLQLESVLAAFMDTMKVPAKQMKDKFEQNVAIKRKTGSQKEVDRVYTDFMNMTESEYDEFKNLKSINSKGQRYRQLEDQWLQGLEFNEDKARVILTGDGPDSSYFNGIMESLSMNTDPLIQSVHALIQKTKSEYDALSGSMFADYTNDIIEFKKKVDTKDQNKGKFGKEIGFIDNVGVIDQDGNLTEQQEWTFLNPWKDFSIDEARLSIAVTEAAAKFKDTSSPADKKEYIAAQRELQLWKNQYKHQAYHVDYYKADDLLMKDAIGIEASERSEEILSSMSVLNNDNADGKYDLDLKNLKLELKKLSLSYDELGNKKTGMDLAVAERLSEYTKLKSGFNTREEIPGAFQDAYDTYTEHLKNDLGIPVNSDEYQSKINTWLNNNTVASLKDSVGNRMNLLQDEKARLLSKLTAKNKDIYDTSDLEKIINDAVSLLRDEGIQPDGRNASKELRSAVKQAQIDLEKHRLDHIQRSGLTKDELSRYNQLFDIYNTDSQVWNDPENKKEFEALNAKKYNSTIDLGLDAATLLRVDEINSELANMSTRLPTDYYNSEFGLLLTDDEQKKVIDHMYSQGIRIYSTGELIGTDVIDILNSSIGTDLLSGNQKLNDWVDQNHYISNGIFIPLKIWTVSTSKDPFDYNVGRFIDYNGKSQLIKIDDTYRIPSSKYYSNVVKSKYVTQKQIGITTDNRNKFLPKEESTNRYRNHAYFDLKDEDPDKFEFLENLKSHLLSSQEGLDNNDKLYLAYPKIDKRKLENWQTLNVFQWRRKIKEFLNSRADDAIEFKSEYSKAASHSDALNVFIDSSVQAPIKGTFDINIKDISTDILRTLPQYMNSANNKKALKKVNGYVQTIQDISNDNPQAEWKKGKRIFQKFENGKVLFSTTDKSNRKEILNLLVDREINGVRLAGRLKTHPQVGKLLNGMMGRSAKMNFTFAFDSDIVNSIQMKMSALTHSLSGEFFNPINGAKGESWAVKTAFEISANLRKRGNKSHNELLLNLFDALGGHSMDTMGDTFSRTLLGDMVEGKVTTSMRRFLEVEGNIQHFAALMYQKKVKVTDDNGNEKMIPYINAFETINGVIRTIPGVESNYAVTIKDDGSVVFGDGFNQYKQQISNTLVKLNGAYSKKESPLMSQYIIAKQLLFLKKHLIPLNAKNIAFGIGYNSRNGLHIKKRANWTTGEAEYGHYVTALKALRGTLVALEGKVPHMTKSEMTSVRYVTTQLVLVYFLLPIIMDLLIPHADDDDEDKIDYNAMNTRSGFYDKNALMRDQPYYNFQVKGDILNHLSMIVKKSHDEYASNAPTLMGVKETAKVTTTQAVSLVQNIKIYTNVMDMLINIATNSNDKNAPGRDTGPYVFNEKGYEQGKLLDALFKYEGFNGKTADPVGALQKYEAGKKLKN